MKLLQILLYLCLAFAATGLFPRSASALDCDDFDLSRTQCLSQSRYDIGETVEVKVRVYSSPIYTDKVDLTLSPGEKTSINAVANAGGYSEAVFAFSTGAAGSGADIEIATIAETFTYEAIAPRSTFLLADCKLCEGSFTLADPSAPAPTAAAKTGEVTCNNLTLGSQTGIPGIETELGCIPTNHAFFVLWVLTYFIPFAGGVAFLLLLAGTFTLITSAGNPEKITQAQQIIGSAIAGLLLIIFGVYILSLLGKDIFRIPGFN